MKLALSASAVLLTAGLAWAAPTIDGQNIPSEFPPAVVTQDTNTQFGDNFNEMNQMFVDSDADNIYIAITGNLADNNAIVLWIDTTPTTGSNVVASDPGGACPGDIPTLIRMYSGTTMEPGFSPNYALLVSVGSFPGQGFDHLVMACDLTDLDSMTNTPLGLGILDSGSGVLSLTDSTGVEIALDNSNTGGVGDYNDSAFPGDTGNDPTDAVTGLEISIPRSALGLTGPTPQNVGLFAFLTNNAQGGGDGPCFREGYASNQGLPGITGWGNLASFCPTCAFQLDFEAAPNTNFVLVTIPGI
ncbi:MAG TPA: hypothetical protein ENJ06_04690 [Phycisphaeraceae bacterium]|nr:hypothetical protein [Phycisphaeraceae bacterium]